MAVQTRCRPGSGCQGVAWRGRQCHCHRLGVWLRLQLLLVQQLLLVVVVSLMQQLLLLLLMMMMLVMVMMMVMMMMSSLLLHRPEALGCHRLWLGVEA